MHGSCLQWQLWLDLLPFTWIFLFPVVFVSAWIGGFPGGIVSTFLGAALGIYVFIPEQFSRAITDSRHLYSVFTFIGMGCFISFLFKRYQRTQLQLKKLAENRSAYNRTRLQMALEFARAGMWEWHLDSNKNEWSDSLWELYGLKSGSCLSSIKARLATRPC